MLQVLAASVRVCDAVTLLQKAVEWGTQIAEALRKAAAAGGGGNASAAATAAAPTIQAACAAAAELFNRLQQYIELPAVRREVSSVAPKLLQPLLSILDSTSIGDSVLVAGLQLAAAMLRCVPSSLRPGLPNIERVLQQLVLRTAASTAGSSVSSAGGPVKQQLLAQAAVCAALLPGVPGDAAAWSDAARKLLVSCHDVLDQLLMGLEGRPVDTQFRSYLGSAQQQGQQQGQQPGAEGTSGWLAVLPWQQQQQQQADTQQQQGTTAVQRRQTVPAMLLASFCLSALQQLLAQPFAVPVPVPGYSLALLAARLARFDAAAAVAAGAVPRSSTMYQELLVLQPQLQLAGWQLLQQVIRACGQQLQLQGLLLRLVRQGLRGVQLSGPAALQQQPVAVRSCMYDAAALLLQATGLAGARGLAAEAMGCAVLELYGRSAAAAAAGSGKGSGPGPQRPAKRARKSGGATGNELGQFDPATAAAAAAAGSDNGVLAAAAAGELWPQVAVLGVLKGLLAAGGQVLPAEVRAHADAIVYHISASAAQLETHLAQQPALSAAAAAASGGSGDLAALQVAAYEALLVSVQVPCAHRPPFLSQAVGLFRQGRSSSNVAVAAVCQAAALQLEGLLHPRTTAMGGVRQYAGMDGVPPLSKPRMWDVFAPQPEQQQQQQGAGGAGGGPGLQQAAAAQEGVQSGPEAAGGGGVDAGAGAVVMGYPVNHQQAAAHQQQQQQPPLQQSAAVNHTSAQQGAAPPPPAAMQQEPVMRLMEVDVPAPPQPAAGAQSSQQPQQVQQQQQQPQQGDVEMAAAGVVQQQPLALEQPQQQQAPAKALKVASAAPVFEEESSDSEGPLPDIDSGGDDSDTSEEE